jgi:prolyl-tRNA editing enzyme YbaK/EbsC (Cys-tRNA(Pro) deacylase)
VESRTPVTTALDAWGVSYRLHLHQGPISSVEQAARERGLIPEQIIRSLLFRLENGEFVLVLMPGPGKVSWPKLRRRLGVTRLTTAAAEIVQSITGYPPGSVSPYGLPSTVRLLADLRLLRHTTVSIGAGIPDAGVILRTEDLLRTLQPELDDFGE